MPGVSFVYDRRGAREPNDPAVLGTLDTLLHAEGYSRETILDSGHCFVGCTRHALYPVARFEDAEFLMVLEGALFGKDEAMVEREVRRVADLAFSTDPADRDRIADWLSRIDGEFLLFLLHKPSQVIAVVNDSLALLPFFFYHTADGLVASRELGFVQRLIPEKRCDPLGLAYLLLIRFCPGGRMPFSGVRRLGPGTLLVARPDTPDVEVTALYEWNFDHAEHEARSLEENGARLTELLIEACRNRVDKTGGLPNVLALSGGLDSRLVAVGLKAISAPCHAVSFVTADGLGLSDAQVAGQLADLLGFDWQQIDLGRVTGADVLALLRAKCGLNGLQMSFLLAFNRVLKDRFRSDFVYFTGNTGQGFKAFLHGVGCRDLDDVVHRGILAKYAGFPIDAVTRLVGVPERAILDDLKEYLAGFPEVSLQGKWTHFRIFDRDLVSLQDGMDRGRFYFRCAFPLHAPQLFAYSMGCPDDQKAKSRLYQPVLDRLHPGSWRVPYAPCMVGPGSLRYTARCWMGAAYHRLPQAWRNVIGIGQKPKAYTQPPNANMVKCLRAQMSNCPFISDYVCPSAAEELLATGTRWDVEVLFNVVSAIEFFKDGRSTIEEYRDEELM